MFETSFYIARKGISHVREVYSIMDLLSDLGGVAEIILISVGSLLGSFTTHSFLLRSLKNLFYVKLDKEGIF